MYRSPFIERQLQSMVQQVEPLDQIVLVDDSGDREWSDHATRGLRGYSGELRRITNNQNLGMRRSYELALRSSTSDIVFCADHDDEWYPQKTERVMQFIQKTGAKAVFHDLAVYASTSFQVSSGDHLGTFFDLYSSTPERATLVGFEEALHRPPASGSALAFRRELIPENLRFPSTTTPDHFLQMLFTQSTDLVRINEVLGNYRRHDTNVSDLPTRSTRQRTVTEDPTELVEALRGVTSQNDALLFQYRDTSTLRRSVQMATFGAWVRERRRALGISLTLRLVFSVYKRPWRLAGDLLRRKYRKSAACSS